MADILYWIWLSLICGTRYNLSEKLLLHFDNNPENIFSASDSELLKICDRPVKESITHDLQEAQSIKDYCIKNNTGLLTPDNEYYPERLRKIKDKPPFYIIAAVYRFDTVCALPLWVRAG